MKPALTLLTLLTLAGIAPFAVATDTKESPEPITWGVMGQTSGCVIFAEGHKTSGRFYGVAIAARTVGKLTVVETENYALDQKQYLETQENLDALMQRAQKTTSSTSRSRKSTPRTCSKKPAPPARMINSSSSRPNFRLSHMTPVRLTR